MRKNIYNYISIIFIMLITTSCNKVVKDYDGNMYSTIKIGNQIWLKENLKVKHYNNGDPIHKDIESTEGAYTAKNIHYYNWYAITDSRGICPKGYHVPSRKDWQELISYLGSNVTEDNGSKYVDKIAASALKYSDGFFAFGSGLYNFDLEQIYHKDDVWYWSSSGHNTGYAYSFRFNYQTEIIYLDDWPKLYGIGVRCVKSK